MRRPGRPQKVLGKRKIREKQICPEVPKFPKKPIYPVDNPVDIGTMKPGFLQFF
jgi:hypothetical protein